MPNKRNDPMSAKELLNWKYLILGDMIQFDVPEGWLKTHHWAIYVGRGNIIHLTTTEDGPSVLSKNISSSKSSSQIISEASLIEFAGDRTVGVNNWADEGYAKKEGIWPNLKEYSVKTEAFEPNEIVQRARDLLKNPDSVPDYHVLDNNCEIFATFCRYGVGFSGQSIAFSNSLVGRIRDKIME